MRGRYVVIAISLVALGGDGLAQEPRIASPPGRSATQVGGRFDERQGYVGGGWIEIRSGRPIKRNRDLFGPDDFVDAPTMAPPSGGPAPPDFCLLSARTGSRPSRFERAPGWPGIVALSAMSVTKR